MAGRIVAMGGLSEPLLRFALSLTGQDRPRIALLPTAGGEDDRGVMRMYELLAAHADVDVVRLFGIPDAPRERIAAADAVLVPGGNTANMLAAWQRGAVLCGWSAGANCWFEASVTDSFREALDPLHDGLAFLSGSFCPHYDAEELRRPVYRDLVDGGFTPGYAADDAMKGRLSQLAGEVITVERPPASACSRVRARTTCATELPSPASGIGMWAR